MGNNIAHIVWQAIAIAAERMYLFPIRLRLKIIYYFVTGVHNITYFECVFSSVILIVI